MILVVRQWRSHDTSYTLARCVVETICENGTKIVVDSRSDDGRKSPAGAAGFVFGLGPSSLKGKESYACVRVASCAGKRDIHGRSLHSGTKAVPRRCWHGWPSPARPINVMNIRCGNWRHGQFVFDPNSSTGYADSIVTEAIYRGRSYS